MNVPTISVPGAPFTQRDLDAWLASSALAAERAAIQSDVDAWPLRELTGDEIKALGAQGNRAEDWSLVQVHADFKIAGDAGVAETGAGRGAAALVTGCRFDGRVILGPFGARGASDKISSPFGSDVRPGLHDSTIADSTICSGVRVSRCGLVSRVLVAPDAVLESVGMIRMSGRMSGEQSAFGNSLVLFDEELFSRRLHAVAELPFAWAAWAAGPEACEPSAAPLLKALGEAAAAYAEAMTSTHAFIGSGSRIEATALIEDCWIGGGVSVEAAGALRDCTLWATPDEPTLVRDGAQLRTCLVGPGCTIDHLAIVDRTIFFEHARVGAQAIVRGSAIGANVRLSEAEITDSFVGPFVSAVHHSLLIGAYWPEGRGNVAYGANVGSNHTGRAPDQEIFPGEGVFFGLGTNIKFPANYSEAPYSIIATGVDALPQRVSFPFSLIAARTHDLAGVSPALNEIRPGWMLLHNAYGVERAERKFAERNRARRHAVELAVFRPDIIGGFTEAAGRLALAADAVRSHYTDDDIPGLGKNILTEPGREQALEAYALGRRVGAARLLLRGLAAVARSDKGGQAVDPMLIVFAGNILGCESEAELIESALDAEAEWLKQVRRSKDRDWARGETVIDDYAARHVDLDHDPTVIQCTAELEDHRSRAGAYRALIGQSESSSGNGAIVQDPPVGDPRP